MGGDGWVWKNWVQDSAHILQMLTNPWSILILVPISCQWKNFCWLSKAHFVDCECFLLCSSARHLWVPYLILVREAELAWCKRSVHHLPKSLFSHSSISVSHAKWHCYLIRGTKRHGHKAWSRWFSWLTTLKQLYLNNDYETNLTNNESFPMTRHTVCCAINTPDRGWRVSHPPMKIK